MNHHPCLISFDESCSRKLQLHGRRAMSLRPSVRRQVSVYRSERLKRRSTDANEAPRRRELSDMETMEKQ